MQRMWMRGLFVLLMLVPLAVSLATPVVLDSGAIEGVRDGPLRVFKGIPFAAPPVGDSRWREPRSPAPWTGVRKATTFAPACMQTGVSMPGEIPPTTSEDCLYLNIWTPASAKNLPVIVWIYGGGFFNGSASMPLYWGDRLARKGAVIVTFGYRVGPFGFLAHPELTKESPHHSSGNYGLLDQIAALRWVQRHVAAFGGDPARITIAGQSAGAASVSILMSSPLAKGLFQRAIAESGGMFEPMQLAPNYQLVNAEREGEAYARSVGATSLADLRALSAAALLKGNAGEISHPVIEPEVMPRSPYDTFASGEQNDVPILIGSNENEARSLIPDLAAVRAATFEADITKRWGVLPPALLAPYPHTTDAQAVRARLDFERDLRFGWDMWAWASLTATNGKSPVYYYHFDHDPPFPSGSVYAGWGPSHYSELWYSFDHLNQESWAWTRADRLLATHISSYWVNFARSGNPNGKGLPIWPPFTRDNQQVLYLDDPTHAGPVAHVKELQAIDAVYSQVRAAPPTATP